MNIKFFILIFFLIIGFFSCEKKYQPRSIEKVNLENISIDSSSIRAIHTAIDSSLIYATSDGYIGLYFPSNKGLKTEKIMYDTIVPHFRSIASNNNDVYVLSIGNPALLYEYSEGDLKIVYKEEHPKVFYDAMAFFDEMNGIAMGDPVENCLSILITRDGGKTWNKIPCKELPKTAEGEAAFAASNSNVAIVGSHAWLVTGGAQARVFHTPDMGKTWEVFNSPIIAGSQMTGIYSVDFYDENNGIIFGGDWNDKENNIGNKAITTDGGKTWQLVADGKEPGYKSCVQYVPNSLGKEIFAVGTNGISFSNDGGKSWKNVSKESYYTIRFVNENFAWLAGNNKIGKMNLK